MFGEAVVVRRVGDVALGVAVGAAAVAALLTLEAVRSVKRWEVGDEPAGACEDGVRRDDS